MTLGENIIYYRKKREITQEQLAEIMQVSRQSVSKWENNEAVPELQKLIKLTDVLEVGLDELCGRVHTSTDNQVETKEVSAPRRNTAIRIISIVLVTVLLVAGTAVGFFVGQSSATDAMAKNFYQTTGVTCVEYGLQKPNLLICTIMPEVYVEDFDYVLLVSNGWKAPFEVELEFENQIGTASFRVDGSSRYNLTLQVKNGDVVHNINLVEKLYANTQDGIVYIHDEKIKY